MGKHWIRSLVHCIVLDPKAAMVDLFSPKKSFHCEVFHQVKSKATSHLDEGIPTQHWDLATLHFNLLSWRYSWRALKPWLISTTGIQNNSSNETTSIIKWTNQNNTHTLSFRALLSCLTIQRQCSSLHREQVMWLSFSAMGPQLIASAWETKYTNVSSQRQR